MIGGYEVMNYYNDYEDLNIEEINELLGKNDFKHPLDRTTLLLVKLGKVAEKYDKGD